ncbi:hypothetical protein FLP15_10260 [Lactococcus protaetiae]|uniref:Uncharacterized protein n=2 Tax=Lactococcus protaetiae TaxID=2592653 RepID=A0A514ZA80_9LACT|nr:hypothetical protein FLP15_10260 [Lactococcus protaetiae]
MGTYKADFRKTDCRNNQYGKRGGMMETIANIINLIGGIVLISVVIFWGRLAKRFSKLLSNIEQENIDRSELDESENVF